MKMHTRLPAAGLVSLTFFLVLWQATAQTLAPTQKVEGHLPKANGPAHFKGRLDAARHLDLTIGLPLRNQAGLSNLLQRIYDPASPDYRHYLTPAQFTEQFGPSAVDYQAVMAFAKAHGLAIKATHPNRMLLEVNGDVAAIEQALHVKLNVYQHPTENRTYYAPDADPALDLSTKVLDVSGLNNYSLPRPRLKTTPLSEMKNTPGTNFGSGPIGLYMGNDFRAAYVPGSPLTGAGQAIGLLEFDGYTAADITNYEYQTGLPTVAMTNVLLDGVSGRPSGSGGQIEVSLDIELAIAMAPGISQMIVYEGTDWHDLLNRMANDNLARQLSCSWFISGGGPDPVADQIWQQMAAQGQSFFNASGDLGAYAGPIDFPGDSPYITQVGGTTLSTTGPGGTYVSETVWNWGNGNASGGGVSTYYPIPTWQARVDMTANHGSSTMRNTPDVALTSDNIYVRANFSDYSAGGTSCAAPMWAAFVALANQQAVANGRPAVGFINPPIYALGQEASYTLGLHDVTTGNNATPFTPPGLFPALPGYDLSTGWGSPNGANLINALVSPGDSLQINPGLGFAANGPTAGPFAPASQGYTLKNTSASTMNWSLVNTSSWLNVSTTGGQIKPGGAVAALTASLAPAAAGLPVGTYTATVWFTNGNTGFGQSRVFTLQVTNFPVAITQQPTNQSLLVGGSASFVVGATGSRLNYQWLKNGLPMADGDHVSGSATASLIISNASVADAAVYSVLVTNSVSSATSAGAALAVYSPGGGQLAQNGGFETGDFTYWNLSGNTNSSIVTTNNAAVHAGAFGAQIGASGSPCYLSQTVPTVPGAAYLISFWLDSPDGLSPNDCIVEWSTNIIYSVANLEAVGWTNLQFTVIATGSNTVLQIGLQDDPSYLAVDDVIVAAYTNVAIPPTILVQPVTQTASPGGVANFSIVAAGTQPLSYTWMANGVPIPGATQSNLTFNVAAYASTQISCVVSNTYGVALSSVALLTVAGPVYFFGGPDGGVPGAALTLASDGSMYGTTEYGGDSNYGTVFRLSTNGLLGKLASFNLTNGALAMGNVMQAADGNLYGTTEAGGAFGDGTIFRLTTNGAVTALVSFTGTNGSSPQGGLLQTADGNFYGLTTSGGSNNVGSVFKMSADGTLTTLLWFKGTNGASPYGNLIQGLDGNLYGTTSGGGLSGNGTVFRVTTNGTLTLLANFNSSNGAHPQAGLLQTADGSLWGTTVNGGASSFGSVFHVTTNGILTTLVSFMYTNGASPQCSLVQGPDGRLYGTTQSGGTAGQGTIFGVTAQGTLSRLLSFNGPQGANPSGGLVVGFDGNLYGVTASGGLGYNGAVPSGDGTVFCLVLTNKVASPAIAAQPAAQTTTVGGAGTFAVQVVSSGPVNYSWLRNGSPIAGALQPSYTITNVQLTDSGAQFSCQASNGLGVVLSSNALLSVLAPTNSGSIFAFDALDGATPIAGLTAAGDGSFYGTTAYGGSNFLGSIFRITTNGAMTTLVNFAGTNGTSPVAALVQGMDGNFYGTTASGGAGYGTLFRMTPPGTLTTLVFFSYYNGATPYGQLVQGPDGTLYGTTANGGSANGTVFSVTTNGVLTPLVNFNSANGANPAARLTFGPNGNLYGTTVNGGPYNQGTAFMVTTNGVLASLVNFNVNNGANPYGELFLAPDGNFYGTTAAGGSSGFGSIFMMATNGVVTTLASFNGTNGAGPYSGLALAPDGNFYGGTTSGGTYNQGTIFRVTPAGVLDSLQSFQGAAGSGPRGTIELGADGSFYGTVPYGGTYYDGQVGSGNGFVFRTTIPAAPANSRPSITGQPASQSVFVGGTASFGVTANGSLPLYFFWQRNGLPIAGANGALYTVKNLQLADSGSQFSCLVSNAYGTNLSSIATITVSLDPNLTQNGGFEAGNFTSWGGTKLGAIVTTDSRYIHSGLFGANLGPVSSFGFLAQTLATTAGSNYLVSAWLDNVSGTANEFLVIWNGTNIFDGVNLPVSTWTNLQFVVAATGSTSTVQFAYRGSNFGLDDFRLTPFSSPTIASVAWLGNGEIQLSMSGLPLVKCHVLGSTNLINWHTVAGLTNYTDTLQFSDPNATNCKACFYQIVVP